MESLLIVISTLKEYVLTYLPYFIVSIVLIKLWISQRKSISVKPTEHSNCGSDACVRCHKYVSTTNQALNKLYYLRHLCLVEDETFELLQAALEHQSEKWLLDYQKPNVFYLPTLTAKPWWNVGMLPDCVHLESHAHSIIDEFEAVESTGNSATGKTLKNNTVSGEWTVLHLINQGAQVEANMARFPVTWSAIQQCQTVMRHNVFGNVSFSVLNPGTRIEPHHGPSNLRLRCQLGIRCSDRASLTVCSERRHVAQGRACVFDDSFLHSAEYLANAPIPDNSLPRVVLIVDLWHPELRTEQRSIIDELFMPS